MSESEIERPTDGFTCHVCHATRAVADRTMLDGEPLCPHCFDKWERQRAESAYNGHEDQPTPAPPAPTVKPENYPAIAQAFYLLGQCQTHLETFWLTANDRQVGRAAGAVAYDVRTFLRKIRDRKEGNA